MMTNIVLELLLLLSVDMSSVQVVHKCAGQVARDILRHQVSQKQYKTHSYTYNGILTESHI